MEQQNSIYYRSFFLSFSAAFFLLSVLFLFLVTTVHPQTPASLTDQGLVQEVEIAYVPQAQDSITVLFIGTRAGSVESGSYLLARFDPVGGRVPVIALPRQTLVNNGSGAETLEAVYRYGGAEYVRAALERTLDIPIDRYVRMTDTGFVAAAAVIGTVEFELEEDLPLEQGSIQTILNQGMHLVDGQKALAVMTHQGEGELERCRMGAQLAAAIINQRIDVVESAWVDQVFQAVINLVDSDISYNDYYERKDAAVFLAQLQQAPAVPLEVSGQYGEDSFVLDDTCLARLLQYFV